MNGLVPLQSRIVFKALKRAGFVLARQKGSHTIWKHPDGRTTVVPVHRGERIGRGLIRKIISDMEITVEEFLNLLK